MAVCATSLDFISEINGLIKLKFAEKLKKYQKDHFDLFNTTGTMAVVLNPEIPKKVLSEEQWSNAVAEIYKRATKYGFNP